MGNKWNSQNKAHSEYVIPISAIEFHEYPINIAN